MVNDVILYKTDDGKSAIELHLDNGTVWLSQRNDRSEERRVGKECRL